MSRRIKPRVVGGDSKRNANATLSVPVRVAMEITGKDNAREAALALRERYEFEAELTSEGILFHPIKIVTSIGW